MLACLNVILEQRLFSGKEQAKQMLLILKDDLCAINVVILAA